MKTKKDGEKGWMDKRKNKEEKKTKEKNPYYIINLL